MNNILSEQQSIRYSRHLLLKEFGGINQEKLLSAKVLIIGVGGLGCASAMYLAAAGVGTLGLADPDIVDLSNLQRQLLHYSSDIDRLKVVSASEKLKQINLDSQTHVIAERIDEKNALDYISQYDFIIDATDNFDAKFFINDCCVSLQKPFSHAGVLQFLGQVMTVIPKKTACYRCVFGQKPEGIPSCGRYGVLNTLPGFIGTIQATEAIKYITGIGELLTDTLLTVDMRNFNIKKIQIKNKGCSICG